LQGLTLWGGGGWLFCWAHDGTQFAVIAGVLCTTTSIINLVDLAGIERISATDALNELRVKEGGSTNKSLVFFGKCLTSLADRSKLNGKYASRKL
jgi:hypothetical protein